MSKCMVALSCLTLLLACSPAGHDRASTHVEAARAAAVPGAVDNARAAVDQRYHQHFASRQGFSVDTLRARKAWFTPQLYQLMLADMSSTGEIGYIDFDPFTDAQDDAATYTVGAAHPAHDTVLVEVAVTFPPAVGNGHEQQHITLAMLPTLGGWKIANFMSSDRDLAADLARLSPNAGTAH
jgi:Protein of unknown function (DUF3828)